MARKNLTRISHLPKAKTVKRVKETERVRVSARGAEMVAGVTRVDTLNQIKSALNAKCAK